MWRRRVLVAAGPLAHGDSNNDADVEADHRTDCGTRCRGNRADGASVYVGRRGGGSKRHRFAAEQCRRVHRIDLCRGWCHNRNGSGDNHWDIGGHAGRRGGLHVHRDGFRWPDRPARGHRHDNRRRNELGAPPAVAARGPERLARERYSASVFVAYKPAALRAPAAVFNTSAW
jgi:hypothetical protein